MLNKMISKKKMTRMFLIGPVVGTMLGVGILIGCAGDTGLTEGRDSGGERVSQEISERGGGESGGEHSGRAEVAEGGSEGPEGGGSEEGSGANQLAPDETFDTTRAGARLIMNYDADKQLLQRHRGEHDQQHADQCQDRNTPVERSRAWADHPGGHGSG